MPSSLDDPTLMLAAKYRSRGRLPVLSWRNPTLGSVLCRCSQPQVGVTGKTSKHDEQLLYALCDCGSLGSGPSTGAQTRTSVRSASSASSSAMAEPPPAVAVVVAPMDIDAAVETSGNMGSEEVGEGGMEDVAVDDLDLLDHGVTSHDVDDEHAAVQTVGVISAVEAFRQSRRKSLAKPVLSPAAARRWGNVHDVVKDGVFSRDQDADGSGAWQPVAGDGSDSGDGGSGGGGGVADDSDPSLERVSKEHLQLRETVNAQISLLAGSETKGSDRRQSGRRRMGRTSTIDMQQKGNTAHEMEFCAKYSRQGSVRSIRLGNSLHSKNSVLRMVVPPDAEGNDSERKVASPGGLGRDGGSRGSFVEATHDYLKTSALLIADARPKINAMANKLKGKGYENTAMYKEQRIDLKFMGIGNIHVMRKAQIKLLLALNDGNWQSAVDKSNWIHHLQLILSSACRVAASLASSESVLVHCSDGECILLLVSP